MRNISIHAPRTGSDADYIIKRKLMLKFQSTLPARGATRMRHATPRRAAISIHAPRTGSDIIIDISEDAPQISIHAPRTGSDAFRAAAFAAIV